MEKRTAQSTTTTSRSVETQRRDLVEALRQGQLNREEELVLRMRHGISEPGSTPLTFRGQEVPEIKAKLALIEADLLSRLRPEPAAESTGDDALKAHIIDRLKRL